jgi:hypothetical protein
MTNYKMIQVYRSSHLDIFLFPIMIRLTSNNPADE